VAIEADVDAAPMKRRGLVALAIIGTAIAANYAPLLETHAEQDDCIFGPVSNERYRQYLATVKAQLEAAPSFYSDRRPLALRLDSLFEQVSGNETDVYSRIAIMHATLRAVGAEHRNTNGTVSDRRGSDPYLEVLNRNATVSFNYALDVNRLWTFLPWPRDAWVIGVLAGPRYEDPPGPLYPKKSGGLTFIVNGPNPIDTPLGIEISRDSSCPSVPGDATAREFSLKSD
jgi:hypothetical protein